MVTNFVPSHYRRFVFGDTPLVIGTDAVSPYLSRKDHNLRLRDENPFGMCSPSSLEVFAVQRLVAGTDDVKYFRHGEHLSELQDVSAMPKGGARVIVTTGVEVDYSVFSGWHAVNLYGTEDVQEFRLPRARVGNWNVLNVLSSRFVAARLGNESVGDTEVCLTKGVWPVARGSGDGFSPWSLYSNFSINVGSRWVGFENFFLDAVGRTDYVKIPLLSPK